ncbi:hypothetical protein BGZ96_008632 [Linnemannia gamsii]|uniref:Uncharacterized protein n=1 Tax=Linnemannia gamsii TaxID=64522 RepID=A0ABQ7JXY5_9FUNG|nr:hypothetical protein BGZ96_008632 [Linnemannia gamsii]
MSEDLRLSSLLLLLQVVQGSGGVILRNHINIRFMIIAIDIAILPSAATIVSRSDTPVLPVVGISSTIRMIVSTIIAVTVAAGTGAVVEIGPADSAHAACFVAHRLMVLLFLTTRTSSMNGYVLNLVLFHRG